jgi:hypothetical protein
MIAHAPFPVNARVVCDERAKSSASFVSSRYLPTAFVGHRIVAARRLPHQII